MPTSPNHTGSDHAPAGSRAVTKKHSLAETLVVIM